MKINELEPNTKVLNLVGKISHLEPATKTPNGADMQEGILEDDSGQVKLTLWGDQVGKFLVGDKILMTTGWCKEFESELQISTGKFGKMTKVPEMK